MRWLLGGKEASVRLTG
ncbi:hypothetical protein Gohar_001403 [Gossypium harknessii]|uniref:Uncharacterized protein n=1 Tax=Gossypium harknessii TaxID=34285 RepID=A0A7J9I3T4_9ROSI|nr:hypothetical protein [Gossypium harknessii]